MVTTVTTATTVAVTLAGMSLSLSVILALVALLIEKEVVSGLKGPRAKRLSQVLNVVIAPLVTVFVAALVLSVAEVLR